MKIGFSQKETLTVGEPICADFFDKLPNTIYQKTGFNYACMQIFDGFFLKPSYKNMPYRNAFVPEITVLVSKTNEQTVLHLKGQPVKFVRTFIGFWLSFLLVMQVLLFTVIAPAQINVFFPGLAPAMIGILGYLLCSVVTKGIFKSIVRAIQKELYLM